MSRPSDQSLYEVVVWVYDLSQGMAKSMSPMLLGREIEAVYHTGIVVYGSEYFFGGGIASSSPGATQAGAPIRKVSLGLTTKKQSDFHTWLRTIGDEFTAETYNIMSHNCNNFSDRCAQWLLEENPQRQAFPVEILDLPRIVLSTPMGQMFRPMLEQLGPNRDNNNGGNGGGSFIPAAQEHLLFPPAIHNSPPDIQSITAHTTVQTLTTTSTTTTTTPPTDLGPYKLEIPFHRVSSMTELGDITFTALANIPPAPAVENDATTLGKSRALLSAALGNPNFKKQLAIDPSLQSAVDVCNESVTQLLAKTKGTISPLVSINYSAGLRALQQVSVFFPPALLCGIVGIYSSLLSQLCVHALLQSQQTQETAKQGGLFVREHAMAKELINEPQNNTNRACYDGFITHMVQLYISDIIPGLSQNKSSGIPNSVVFKFLRQNVQELFLLVIDMQLTTESVRQVLQLAMNIITTLLPIYDDKTLHKSRSPLHENEYNAIIFALRLLLFYITSQKTNYEHRPPIFQLLGELHCQQIEHEDQTEIIGEIVLSLNHIIMNILHHESGEYIQYDTLVQLLPIINLILHILGLTAISSNGFCLCLMMEPHDTVQQYVMSIKRVLLSTKLQQNNIDQKTRQILDQFTQLLADLDAIVQINASSE